MVISAHTMPVEVDASTSTECRVVPVACHLTQDKAVNPEEQCEFSARVVMGVANIPRVIDKISGSAT
ncbi:hypothetical protein QR685DRAFT_496912 [Neurospora intermedia]|uniref:Uncharacterized protein n=1 Tax=Neurospora intermedia TaxID=5142 RepID=A0ABR3DCJ8_NEUIN